MMPLLFVVVHRQGKYSCRTDWAAAVVKKKKKTKKKKTGSSDLIV
jgi:hypothetical protein